MTVKRVEVLAYAKINLMLDIIRRRTDGYHDLFMIMQSVGVADRVTVEREPGRKLRLTASMDDIPLDDKNIAWKAAALFFKTTGLRRPGLHIHLEKHIPHAAGLAGGSADGAAVLVALNRLMGTGLSTDQLCAMGVQIGADVPFALMGGTCRVQGVGDVMKALPPCPDCWFTVVMPDYGVSTPEAFAAYDKVGSSTHPDCEAQEKAIRAEDLAGVCAAAGNALEECSGARDNEAIKTALKENGAVTALMTGSGAAVFGIFESEEAARSAAEAVRAQWPQVYVAQPDKGGARVVSPKWLL